MDVLQLLSENPTLGRKTNSANVRVKIVRNYLVFYEFSDSELMVLSIWDGRRDEQIY